MKEIKVTGMKTIRDTDNNVVGMNLNCMITSEDNGVSDTSSKSIKVDGYTTVWKDIMVKALEKLMSASIITQEESDNCMKKYE